MFKRLIIILIAIALGLVADQTVQAAAPDFNVGADLPRNQQDRNLHYFDLVVAPGSQQTLSLTLQNTATGTQRFAVSTNRATTSASGTIDYGQHAAPRPASLSVDIESLLPKPRVYTLEPHSTRQITLKLTAPSTAWQGVLLGGIRVEKLAAASGDTAGTATAVHAAQTIPIQLRATANPPEFTANLTFNGLTQQHSPGGTLLAIKLENTVPAIQKGVNLHAAVYPANKTKAVLEKDANDLKLAPTAVMTMPLGAGPANLAPGHYRLEVNASQGDHRWRFFKTFTIKATATKVTQSAQPATAKATTFPAWVGGLLLAAIALLGWLAWRLKRRQE